MVEVIKIDVSSVGQRIDKWIKNNLIKNTTKPNRKRSYVMEK